MSGPYYDFPAPGAPNQKQTQQSPNMDFLGGAYGPADFLSGDDGSFINTNSELSTDTTSTPIGFDVNDIFAPTMPQAQEMQPMQPIMQQFMPAPMGPVPPANGPPGAAWHPQIGFYYPVAPVYQSMQQAFPPGGFLPDTPQMGYPQPVSFPPAFPQQFAAPVAQMTGLGPVATPVVMPKKTKKLRQGSWKKRKTLGPQNMMEQRDLAGKRQKVTDSPSPQYDVLDISDDDEPVRKPICNIGRSSKKDTAATYIPTGKIPSIDQPCICDTQIKKIPRPRNAFILYRQQQQRNLIRSNTPAFASKNGKGIDQGKLSRAAGDQWNNESPEVRKQYQQLAELEKINHARLYPDYQYRPRKAGAGAAGQKAFGTTACRCGAYARNVAKMQAAGFAGFDDPDVSMPDAEPAFPAPVAQMTAEEPQPTQRYPGHNAVSAAQRATNKNLMARFQKTHDQSASTAPLRRSSRNRSSISYAEPSDNVEGLDDFETLLTAQLSEALAPPAPMQEGKPKTPRASTSGRRPSPIITPFNSPPSQNTRAKSIVEMPTLPENEIADFDDLFGESGGDEEFFHFDVHAATAAAASPSRRRSSIRTASRKTSKQSPGLRRSPRRSSRGSGSPSGINKGGYSPVTTRSRRTSSAPRRSPRHSPRN